MQVIESNGGDGGPPLPPPHPTPYPMRLICCSLHLASNRAPVAAPPSAGGDGGWPRQRRLQEARRRSDRRNRTASTRVRPIRAGGPAPGGHWSIDGARPLRRRTAALSSPPTATGPVKAAEDSEPPGPTQTGSRALAPGLPYRLAL